jgi:alpha-D-ribose 1-methylphosphonate 5-triphosphate diphosphatase
MAAWAVQRGALRQTTDDIERRMAERAGRQDTVEQVYDRIRAEAQRQPLRIASHDDDSPEKVEVLHDLGARVTEFPVTVEAARRARELGMTIVVGAPNIVRGGSSSGNQDASELFSLGLADVICADYHAPSLLPSAFRLVDDGLVELPSAVRALTANAAQAVGLNDIGVIARGYVADLILVRRGFAGVPQVERVIRGGREVLVLQPVRAEVRA